MLISIIGRIALSLIIKLLLSLSYQLRGLLIAVAWLCPQFLGYDFPSFFVNRKDVVSLLNGVFAHVLFIWERFVGPITSIIQSLRKELYMVPYHEIDWNEARNLFFSFKLSTFNFYPSIL